MWQSVKSFASDVQGGIAIQASLALPILIMLVGGVLDYGQAINQRQRLQDAVDKSALAAARELGLSDARRENVQAIVEGKVQASLTVNGGHGLAPSVVTKINEDPFEVAVTAQQLTQPYFGGSFGIAPLDLEVHAVARIVGRPNICVLGLDPSAGGTISLEQGARVTALNCAVFSNSTDAQSIKSKQTSVLTASLICSAGGRDGTKGNFMPEPLMDCPTFDDPLAGRPEPAVGACDKSVRTRIQGNVRLTPATFCGGLRIEDGAEVELAPGTYVIKDGEFRVGDKAKLKGAGVTFFFIGKGAQLRFERLSTIDLTAPNSGSMAGLLMFESRSQGTNAKHQILSDDARNLLGTIYLSRGQLHVDANNPVADKSAYTAIVTRMLTLYGGPNLVLNTNYDLTDIPVPAGIRGAGQPATLVK